MEGGGKMIRKGGLTMSEITQRTGFDSSSRFSKVFHQLEGIPPQRYAAIQFERSARPGPAAEVG